MFFLLLLSCKYRLIRTRFVLFCLNLIQKVPFNQLNTRFKLEGKKCIIVNNALLSLSVILIFQTIFTSSVPLNKTLWTIDICTGVSEIPTTDLRIFSADSFCA